MDGFALTMMIEIPNLVVANIFQDVFGNLNTIFKIGITLVLAAAVLAFFAGSFIRGIAKQINVGMFLLGLFGIVIAASVIAAFTAAFVF